jgi:hypothetical protein
MTRASKDYQVSGKDGGRQWPIPVTRLENGALGAEDLAEGHFPTAVKSATNGLQMVGTVLSETDINGVSHCVVDLSDNMIYFHDVRNITVYANGTGATPAAINVGDPIYYDRSEDMPDDVFLSLSPLDEDGELNPLFGYASVSQRVSMPAGTSAAISTQSIAVAQVGLSGGHVEITVEGS